MCPYTFNCYWSNARLANSYFSRSPIHMHAWLGRARMSFNREWIESPCHRQRCLTDLSLGKTKGSSIKIHLAQTFFPLTSSVGGRVRRPPLLCCVSGPQHVIGSWLLSSAIVPLVWPLVDDHEMVTKIGIHAGHTSSYSRKLRQPCNVWMFWAWLYISWFFLDDVQHIWWSAHSW